MESENSSNFLDLNQANIHDDHSQNFQNLSSNNIQRGSQQNVIDNRSVRSANSRATGRSTPMGNRRFTPSQSHSRFQRGTGTNYNSQTPNNNLEMIPENQIDSQSMASDHYESRVFWGTRIKVQDIENRFKKFIREADCPENRMQLQINFMEDENLDDEFANQPKTFKYIDKLRQICEVEKYTLQVDAEHLFFKDKFLYNAMVLAPCDILPIMDNIVTEIAREQSFLLQENLHKQILVSLMNLKNITKMRELAPKDINRLVQIKGIVIRCSEIYPEMREATFRCSQCKHEVQSQLENGRFLEPTDCAKCKQKFSFDLIHNLCLFTDKQLIKLQEMPDTVPDGETPQTITLLAYNDDFVDAVKPGDKVDVIGVYRCQPIKVTQNQRIQKSVFRTYIDVTNYQKSFYQNGVNDELQKVEGDDDNEDKMQFSEDQEQTFFKLAQDEKIYDRLVQAFAPSIWENEDVKKGILTQLFGGTQKIFSQTGKGRFRAEINILLVGDPSTAKSQLLQYVNKIAPRGIYTSGKGSSAVGLTAYVTRDVETKQIILESGALVLSDKGICCVDEFDKMDDNGRTILHEAMEQQTISVAKAGIVCQLNSRTSILASANPVESKYNSKLSVIQNIKLPPTLLSRFDLIYLMLDNINDTKDKRLAGHILNLYGNQENIDQSRLSQNIIDRQTLAKYIQYAKQQIKPKLSEEAANALIQGYTDMRQMGTNKNMITATPRQLESLIRISEALAKMRLDPIVNENDVQEAIRLMQVATQTAVTDPTTGLIDMDMINTGHTAVEREKIQKIIAYVQEIISINKDRVTKNGISFNELLQATDKKFSTIEGVGNKVSLESRELLEALRQMQEENLVLLTSHSKTPIIKLGSSFIF